MATARPDYIKWPQSKLIKEIEKLKKRKRYGLVWEDKPEHIIGTKFPTLKEVGRRQIATDRHDPYNILIQGDNYHALSVLNYTHKGRIDVIYIDPPYNIGKEFIYNDKLVDKDDGYKHSKWLSFMSKRLRLAQKLLSDKGVIFISIDDNEQAQLKLLCDEIFIPENFIANIVWQKKYSPQNDAQYFSDMHDYILVYAKRKNSKGEKNGWIRNLISRTKKMNMRYKNPDGDPRGSWKPADFSVKTYNKKYDYPIRTPSGRIVHPPRGRCWETSKERFQQILNNNDLWFGKNGNNIPSKKVFLSQVQQGVVPITWWERRFAGDNQEAKQELKEILSKQELVFDTPKPVKLIKRILQIASTKESVILDFFAGSGTTGQAVLELNMEDGGNRKFILCTNNENNICTDVCYPRLKKVINGYKFKGKQNTILFEEILSYSKIKKCEKIHDAIEQHKLDRQREFDKFEVQIADNTIRLIGIKDIDDKNPGLGGNLKYFKTDFVDSAPTDFNKKKLVDRSTELLCIKEGCFEEIKTTKIYSLFRSKTKHMAIIYDDDGVEPAKKAIKKTGGRFTAYVFSLDDYDRTEEFEDMAGMVDLRPIPVEIRNAYKRIRR